jgi:transposase
MGRRRFDRAFKLEVVKLVRERGVSAAQAARDLDVHENVLAQVGQGIHRLISSGVK